MMTTLDFVPGISIDAVVALAYRLYDAQTLINPAFIDQMGGHLIFDASPYLIGIDNREPGALPIRPGTKHQTGVVIDGEGTLAIRVITKIAFEVVVQDGLDRAVNVVFRKK